MTETITDSELHSPNLFLKVLEKIGLREIEPGDICPKENLAKLYKRYPNLLGDQREIDTGMGGRCQSWRDSPGWWKQFIAEQVYSPAQPKF